MSSLQRIIILSLAFILQMTVRANTIDSLRNVLPKLDAKEKSDAYFSLFNALNNSHKTKAALDCLDEWIQHEHKQHNTDREAVARWQKVVLLSNSRLDSLLIDDTPKQMTWFMQHEMWEKYYDTWDSKVQAYIYTGHIQMALREAQTMLDDANSRKNTFGRALAYLQTGVIYEGFGQFEAAVDVFKSCIAELQANYRDAKILNNAYDYLCQTLNKLHHYNEVVRINKEWENFLANNANFQDMYNSTMLACLCNTAEALIGLSRCDEADIELRRAERINDKMPSPIGQFRIWYMRAKLYHAVGEPKKALAFIDSLNQSDIKINSDIKLLQAEVLRQLGHSYEAVDILKKLYLSKDTIYTREMRMQLSEMNTIYKVDELKMQSELQRLHFIIGFVILLLIVLLLFIHFRYKASSKLEKEHQLLQESSDMLERSYKELKTANSKAEESSRMKTDFIQQISHEIRTPLNVLSGFTQILTTQGLTLDDSVRNDINERIIENTKRITELVNKMLELSDANSRAVIECEDNVSAVQILLDAANQMHPEAHPDIAFNINIAPEAEGVTLHTNSSQATRALVLLLDNAFKFTKMGEICVAVNKTKRRVIYSVEDTGIGVPVEEAEHIFDEFVQLDEYYDGTGIGLTVARSIARRLKGDVVLDTKYTVGARFIFSLPLQQ